MTLAACLHRLGLPQLRRAVLSAVQPSIAIQAPSTAWHSTPQTRQMAVWQRVINNNLEEALPKFQKKVELSGLPEELWWRRYHIKKSDMRFLLTRKAYNNEMARRITFKLDWMRRRKYVKS